MPRSPASAIALHVEAAKRLLQELESHASSAMETLGRDAGDEFLAVVQERDRMLGDLDQVVGSLVEARSRPGGPRDAADWSAAFTDIVQAAARALETHNALTDRTRQERDRLARAIARLDRPDTVAAQYAVAVARPRTRTLSITG